MDEWLTMGGRICKTLADEKALLLDYIHMAKEYFLKARLDDHVCDLCPHDNFRMQVVCAAVSFFGGGRMA
eukprot:421355-Pleurochrysis_carterae.AAC.1